MGVLRATAAFLVLLGIAGEGRAGPFEELFRRAITSVVALVDPAGVSVTLRPVASSLALPVEVANAGDGSGRLFIVELGGTVRILRRSGELVAAPFLDVSAAVLAGGERGLLGLAFHPQYATNRRFYVFYTRQPDGAVQVSEYLASAGNPDTADTASARPILSVAHPLTNHNGGRIAFGPDGYLYIGIGDGGGGGDPDGNGQNRDALLGKILRIDVNATSGYLIPADNPFAGQPGADEVWAYGLRNPWKFTFDRQGGGLYIADVGQNEWEEINFEPGGSPGGVNYGWGTMEAAHCFNPSTGCDTSGKTFPVIEHGHTDGWRAIIGGYVYRGTKISALRGFYLYGDAELTAVRAVNVCCGNWRSQFLLEGPGGHTTFGEDEDGELYLASLATGVLYAIEPQAPALAVAPQSVLSAPNASTGFPYRYAGNLAGGGASTAFLASGAALHSVSVGQIIDGAWLITAIGSERIQYQSLATGQEFTLLLSAEE